MRAAESNFMVQQNVYSCAEEAFGSAHAVLRELEDEFSRFHDRLTFVWFDHLSFQEILRRCASLPDNSAIFYVTFGTDAAGAAYADERVLADLHAAANAVGLLYQRRARQRAESDSRRNLALAAAASRRETMSVLTSSIGHELGQPLGFDHVQHSGAADDGHHESATSDTIGEILSDIQIQGVRATQIIGRHRTMLRSRQLDTKPIDLHAVITETLALVAHDMSTRQVEATVDLSSNRCVINGDQVLLQQVFVNLIMNAMDAIAETFPARRHVTISSDVRADDVDVSVRDTGPGLPAEIIGTLFRPFVTTKSHGLGIGLAIVQSIVDEHAGTIAARNNPEGARPLRSRSAAANRQRVLRMRYPR
jgi:C4-dicarboxylate-specific signal transduction histidine kinase